MKRLLVRQMIIFIILSISLPSCKAPDKDPIGALNSLVSEYGFIGYQNPLDEARTGTMLSGRPSALAFIANSEDCFPEEFLTRHFDRSNFSRTYQYNFKGSVGFLTSGNPIISAGVGITNKHYVQIELTGITIEYLSSVDITRWYNQGLDNICKDYLDQVGFVIQSISANKMKLSIMDKRGRNISLNSNNITKYFGIELGVEWSITDNYYVEINTPKYIGYQLGSLRKIDMGMSLNRAMTVENDQFIFEELALFQDYEDQQKGLEIMGDRNAISSIDQNSIYR